MTTELSKSDLEALVRKLTTRVEKLARGIPFHVHRCTGELPYHEWECSSPYCLEIAVDCEEHHGPGSTPPPTR